MCFLRHSSCFFLVSMLLTRVYSLLVLYIFYFLDFLLAPRYLLPVAWLPLPACMRSFSSSAMFSNKSLKSSHRLFYCVHVGAVALSYKPRRERLPIIYTAGLFYIAKNIKKWRQTHWKKNNSNTISVQCFWRVKVDRSGTGCCHFGCFGTRRDHVWMRPWIWEIARQVPWA